MHTDKYGTRGLAALVGALATAGLAGWLYVGHQVIY
ncbi:MAG: hypothetical protein QG637_924, partial [Chloroflexota bacterium]|nr:hypothetical protein [Chloroflexota bacterium]